MIAFFKICNYKGFRDSGEIPLAPGMNIVVGRNNSGKTALLEAIALQLSPQNSHRSTWTHSTALVRSDVKMSAELSFLFSQCEFHDLLRAAPEVLVVPTPPEVASDQAHECVHTLLHKDVFKPKLVFRVEHNTTTIQAFLGDGFSDPSNARHPIRLDSNSMTVFPAQGGAVGIPLRDWLHGPLHRSIYLFKAERLNVGQSLFGGSAELAPDARNLPEVLNALQGNNPVRYQRLVGHVRSIFPDIQNISVVPASGGTTVTIKVWDASPGTEERADLTRPLTECGTGIGQVLAILYVAVSSDQSKTILIDEPESFLHPGAARKLLETLRGYERHQFIISTHLPGVISAAQPNCVLKLVKRDGESQIEVIDAPGVAKLQDILTDLGVRLSDVFGMDQILWVEGKTEEECFPIFLGALLAQQAAATAVLGLVATGDVKGKERRRLVQIYKKLSAQDSLIPPALAFVLDRDELSVQQQHDLQKELGLIYFLPRRMYENYLLDAEAISEVLTDVAGVSISSERIGEFMRDRGACSAGGAKDDMDAAYVLREVFQEYGHREYRKVEHGVMLTKAILKRAPGAFDEIKKLVASALTHPRNG